jgi:hypothetical protein
VQHKSRAQGAWGIDRRLEFHDTLPGPTLAWCGGLPFDLPGDFGPDATTILVATAFEYFHAFTDLALCVRTVPRPTKPSIDHDCFFGGNPHASYPTDDALGCRQTPRFVSHSHLISFQKSILIPAAAPCAGHPGRSSSASRQEMGADWRRVAIVGPGSICSNSLSTCQSPSTAIAAVPSAQRQVSVEIGFPVSEIVAQPHISTFAPQQGGSILANGWTARPT